MQYGYLTYLVCFKLQEITVFSRFGLANRDKTYARRLEKLYYEAKEIAATKGLDASGCGTLEFLAKECDLANNNCAASDHRVRGIEQCRMLGVSEWIEIHEDKEILKEVLRFDRHRNYHDIEVQAQIVADNASLFVQLFRKDNRVNPHWVLSMEILRVRVQNLADILASLHKAEDIYGIRRDYDRAVDIFLGTLPSNKI